MRCVMVVSRFAGICDFGRVDQAIYQLLSRPQGDISLHIRCQTLDWTVFGPESLNVSRADVEGVHASYIPLSLLFCLR